ncbi:MAG: hypothetical protein Q8R76_09660 [Candidatus Omnitrophota bacterium]|nr:hypothetical protein [Candidatus Omnitrophota bacterium]
MLYRASRLFFAVLCLLFATNPFAAAERWLNVGGENAFLAWSDYYVDTDSVEREGDILRFRYRTAKKSTREAADAFATMDYLISMDCGKEESMILEMSEDSPKLLRLDTPYKMGYFIKPKVYSHLCNA